GALRGLALGVPFERGRPLRPPAEGEIEALDAIMLGRSAGSRLVGPPAVFDLPLAPEDPGRSDSAAPPASAPCAARRPRLGVDAERREVPATVRRLDQRDHRALEDEVAELDAKRQERQETQTDDRLVEAQERPLAERP